MIAFADRDTIPAPPFAPAPEPPPIVKACGCGRTFNVDQWLELDLVGEQIDAVERLELRTCPAPCRSTIAIVLQTFGGAR
jgi:hypothetical protein